jgi:hypothetical protein
MRVFASRVSPSIPWPSLLALSAVLACASGEVLDEAPGAAPGADAAPGACAPGTNEACTCPGGITGTRSCRADGSGFEPCSCGGGQGAVGGAGAAAGQPSGGQGGAGGTTASGGQGGTSGSGGAGASGGSAGGTLPDGGVDPDASGGVDSGPAPATSCEPGQLVVGVAPGGVVCAGVSAAARDTVNQRCQAYSGWRDSCNACNDAPAKWGSTNQTACAVGAGSICADHTLGGQSVRFTAYVTGGDVNNDDKFYAGLHCGDVTAATSGGAASCPAGQYATGVSEGSVTCSTIDEAIVAYVKERCALYLGWRDSCNGCTTVPSKWGRAGDAICDVTGADSNCLPHALGTETVNLVGINTDGDVGGDDKFHIGMFCAASANAVAPASGSCPAGSFVTGVETDGSVACSDAAGAIADAVRGQCRVYWGWRDSCSSCTNAPAKWGWASSTSCGHGAGADSSCQTATDPWDGNTIQLFGLNTDGDVDSNDRFFMGLVCL